MTPRQIMEDKILPSMENYKRKNGFLAIAELERLCGWRDSIAVQG